LNSVAIGAVYAREKYGYSRIAVVDFDVHHGNGTQEILGEREGYFFVSTHVGDIFPNTGGEGQTVAEFNGGKVVNISLKPNATSQVYKKFFHTVLIPRLDSFHPDLILLSAGFDAHKNDPTENGMRLTKEDYADIVISIREIADRWCKGRIVSVLEGGYNLPSLKRCIEEHLLALMK